jgi:hypothetical protein
MVPACRRIASDTVQPLLFSIRELRPRSTTRKFSLRNQLSQRNQLRHFPAQMPIRDIGRHFLNSSRLGSHSTLRQKGQQGFKSTQKGNKLTAVGRFRSAHDVEHRGSDDIPGDADAYYAAIGYCCRALGAESDPISGDGKLQPEWIGSVTVQTHPATSDIVLDH